MARSLEALLIRARKVPRKQQAHVVMLCMFNCKLKAASPLWKWREKVLSLKRFGKVRAWYELEQFSHRDENELWFFCHYSADLKFFLMDGQRRSISRPSLQQVGSVWNSPGVRLLEAKFSHSLTENHKISRLDYKKFKRKRELISNQHFEKDDMDK